MTTMTTTTTTTTKKSFWHQPLTIHFLTEFLFLVTAFGLVLTELILAGISHYSRSRQTNGRGSSYTSYYWSSFLDTIIALDTILCAAILARIVLSLWYIITGARQAKSQSVDPVRLRRRMLSVLVQLIVYTVFIVAFGLGSLFSSGLGLIPLIFWALAAFSSIIACTLAGIQWRQLGQMDAQAARAYGHLDGAANESRPNSVAVGHEVA